MADWDDDDDHDDDKDDSYKDQDDQDDNQDTDDDGSDGNSSGVDHEQTVNNAGDDEVSSLRGLVGSALSHLEDNGHDVGDIAERAGVDTSDAEALTNGDLASMAQHLISEHSDAIDAVADRFPGAGRLLSALGGGDSGN